MSTAAPAFSRPRAIKAYRVPVHAGATAALAQIGFGCSAVGVIVVIVDRVCAGGWQQRARVDGGGDRRECLDGGVLSRGDGGRRSFMLVVALLPAVLLVLGPPSPLVLLCAFVEAACCLELVRLARRAGSDSAADARDRSVSALPPCRDMFEAALLWSLLAMKYFFLTGHGTNFSSVQWSSAFVGFDEFSAVRGAIMVSLNTFASPLCFCCALPLVVRALGCEDAPSATAAAAPPLPSSRGAREALVGVPRGRASPARDAFHAVVWAARVRRVVCGGSHYERRLLSRRPRCTASFSACVRRQRRCLCTARAAT